MRKIFVRDVKAKFCPTLGNKYRRKICMSCGEKERHYTISMCDILLSHFSLAQFLFEAAVPLLTNSMGLLSAAHRLSDLEPSCSRGSDVAFASSLHSHHAECMGITGSSH